MYEPGVSDIKLYYYRGNERTNHSSNINNSKLAENVPEDVIIEIEFNCKMNIDNKTFNIVAAEDTFVRDEAIVEGIWDEEGKILTYKHLSKDLELFSNANISIKLPQYNFQANDNGNTNYLKEDLTFLFSLNL